MISFAPSVAFAAEDTASGVSMAAGFELPFARSLDRVATFATDLIPLASMLIRELARSAPARYPALRGLLTALLANVARLATHTAVGGLVLTRDRELVARFRQLIERRHRDRWSIGRYAGELAVPRALFAGRATALQGRHRSRSCTRG